MENVLRTSKHKDVFAMSERFYGRKCYIQSILDGRDSQIELVYAEKIIPYNPKSKEDVIDLVQHILNVPDYMKWCLSSLAVFITTNILLIANYCLRKNTWDEILF